MATSTALSSASALAFPFDTHTVRALLRDDEPWFVAADVCIALTIGNSRDALARLDDDEKGVGSIDTPGGTQAMTVINESGLYSLILGSRKPEAKRFKKWVTSEVLPAIRKTGAIPPDQRQVRSAAEAANQVSTQVYRAVLESLLANSRPDWMHAHWHVSFITDSRIGAPPVIQRLHDRAMTGTPAELAQAIERGDMTLDEVVVILGAATKRLSTEARRLTAGRVAPAITLAAART